MQPDATIANHPNLPRFASICYYQGDYTTQEFFAAIAKKLLTQASGCGKIGAYQNRSKALP
jgi:hypothetical protein